MHLTASEVAALIGAFVSVLGGLAAWLRASAAQKAATQARKHAARALNGANLGSIKPDRKTAGTDQSEEAGQ